MAYAMGLPLVATNDVYFPAPDMYEAHDALLCIAEGAYVDQSEPRRRLTPQHYFKTPEEMAALFADLPEALENTVEIAKRCAFRRGRATRSCRASPRTRWRSCAGRRKGAARAAGRDRACRARWKSTRRGSNSSWASSRGWGSRAIS
jgi:hypothetical protein